MEATGESHDSRMLEYMVNSFWNAKALAEFGEKAEAENEEENSTLPVKPDMPPGANSTKKMNIGLNYTINLVLPKTDDPAIYNAIFKSLRENLLND